MPTAARPQPAGWRWAAFGFVPTALALYAELLYANWCVGWHFGITRLTLFTLACWALIFAAPLLVVPARARAAASVAVQITVLFFLLGDVTYFRYCGDLVSTRSLLHANQLGTVIWSPLQLLRPRDAGLALVVAAAWLATARLTRQPRPEPPAGRRVAAATVLAVAALGLLAYRIAPSAENEIFRQLWDRTEMGTTYGLPTFHLVELLNIGNDALQPAPGDAEVAEVRALLAAKQPPLDGLPTWGVARGMDVVVLQLESLQTTPIGLVVGGQPVMPNLDALRRRVRYYPHMFTQIQAGGTSDAEFMAATSLHPVASGAAFVRFAGNDYFTALPQQLRRHGYETQVLKGFPNPHFWNASQMYPALGYGTFFHGQHLPPGEQITLGYSDGHFLKHALPRLLGHDKPTYSMLLTMTGHHPHDAFRGRGPHAFEAVGDVHLADWLKVCHYVDDHVGRFLAGLERAGRWDRTVIAIYGDHPAFWGGSPDFDRLTGHRESPVALRLLRTTPLFLHVPGDPITGEQAIAAGQVDLMPTIAHALGERTPTALGESLLRPRKGFVAFRDGDVVADRTYYQAKSGRAWSLDTGAAVPVPDAGVLARARAELEASDLIIQGDLLRRLAADAR